MSGARGELLFPTMVDHLLDLVAVELDNIVHLTDELDEGSHGGWHLRDEYHGFEVLGDNTSCSGHPRKVGDDFLQGKGRIRVVRNDGGHRAREFQVDGSNAWLSVLLFQGLPNS